MKTQLLDNQGKSIKEIDLPSFFSARIREDLVAKILEAKKKKQPYSPSLSFVCGWQLVAVGKYRMASSRFYYRQCGKQWTKIGSIAGQQSLMAC